MGELHPVAAAYRTGRRLGERDWSARLRALAKYRELNPLDDADKVERMTAHLIWLAGHDDPASLWDGVPSTFAD